ncbi:MAG: segregation/condensation protein A [Clostridia bacterium]|nr:segregation/condensation protein A [Clostridia bacterium]
MAYEVHISQFDGPLDLLLHLIERAEVDIKDIFISQITAEYLAYMRQVDALDMDMASEFLAMAATLLYIKSRSLLPRPPREEDEEEDPEVTLIRQLREYKAFKEATQKLAALRDGTGGSYTKLPEEVLLPPQEYDLAASDLDSLYNAFLSVLSKVQERTGRAPQRQVQADAYTIRAQHGKIRALLSSHRRIRFEELFDGAFVKMEIIVTMMALMDMLQHNEVKIDQDRQYGPIFIEADRLLDDDADIAYMDE